MVIKLYISGISGSKEVKKKQQRVQMILDSKQISYEAIDITEPGKEKDKEFMQQNGKVRESLGKYPLPPQIFNGDDFCGDYEDFDLANEVDELEKFLHIESNSKIIENDSKDYFVNMAEADKFGVDVNLLRDLLDCPQNHNEEINGFHKKDFGKKRMQFEWNVNDYQTYSFTVAKVNGQQESVLNTSTEFDEQSDNINKNEENSIENIVDSEQLNEINDIVKPETIDEDTSVLENKEKENEKDDGVNNDGDQLVDNSNVVSVEPEEVPQAEEDEETNIQCEDDEEEKSNSEKESESESEKSED